MQRTGELSQLVRESTQLSEGQQAELDALAVEQGELADLARNLTAVFDEAADESDDVDESSEELELEGSP